MLQFFCKAGEDWRKALSVKDKIGQEFPVQVIRSVGSSVFVRDRSKEDRIREALLDLHLAIHGFIVHPDVNLRQSTASLARACSIFLRKTVIGDRNDKRTRLLDDDYCQTAGLDFDRLRSVTGERKTLVAERMEVGRCFCTVSVLDDTTLKPTRTQIFPIGPQRLEIFVEWPLPGMVDWVNQPTAKSPWTIRMEGLFESSSDSKLGCDNWLGQQLVLFDNRGISLRDVIRVTANSEGAHSPSISDLSKKVGEGDKAIPNILRDSEIYILSRIRIHGVRYSHAIVIETALYLYVKLMRSLSIEHFGGEKQIPLLCLTPKDVFSPEQDWLRFDGGLTLLISDAGQAISHRIRAPRPR